MRDFITCLEFLTRVRFSKRTDWRDEDFSRSVPYFPLVGLVIGSLLAAVNYGLFYIETPLFLRVTLLLLAEIIITGGLMYDGFMDTADGVFSARSRERMLEIMKDSHVGSNAVLAIIILLLLKIAAYLELSGETLTWVLLTMSVATRTFMVVFIVNFPYARKEGIGHMFTKYAKPFYTYIAFAVCAGIIAVWRWQEYVLLSL
jgi:adenosylcobinamide-GDP ribazoletransferase